MSSSGRALLLLAGLGWAGCGPAAPAPTSVVVAAPTASAAPTAPIESAPEPAPVAAAPHALTPGSNGPRDAAGMIGNDYGAISPSDPVTVMLVGSAAMRVHPLGGRVMQLLTGVFVGWGQFMPLDLIDPLKDLDWVLLLTKRLKNGKKTSLGIPGATSFSGSVDHADRAYVRAKPGLLAIGPAADGKHFAEVMTRAKTAPTFREGELVRVAWSHPQNLPLPMPRGVTAVRVWINDRDGRELVLAAEGDYPDADAARIAVDDLRTMLHRETPSVARSILRPLIDDAAIWADGTTIRYEAVLPEGLVDVVANVVCMRATGHADCARP